MSKNKQPKEESVVSAGKYNAVVKQNEALKQELATKNELLEECKTLINAHDIMNEMQMEVLLKLKTANNELSASNKQSLQFIKMLLNNADLDD